MYGGTRRPSCSFQSCSAAGNGCTSPSPGWDSSTKPIMRTRLPSGRRNTTAAPATTPARVESEASTSASSMR
ncbi:hypothetical protein D3C75_1303640 [compost metagenome]